MNSLKLNNQLIFLITCFIFILNGTLLSNAIIIFLLFVLVINNFYNLSNYLILKFIFLIGTLFSFYNFINNNFEISQLFKFLTLTSLILFHPFKINFSKTQIKTLVFIFIYLFLLQIGYAFGISFIVYYIDTFYPITENLWDYKFDSSNIYDVITNRLAGIYYNPNIMGQSILLLFALIINNLKQNFNKYFTLLFIFFSFFSIVLTGGRTALILFVLILSFNYISYIKKYFFIIIPLISITFIYFISSLDLRVLQNLLNPLAENDSGNAKLEILLTYFQEYNFDSNDNFLKFFFGYLNWDRQFDSDIGYLFSFIGVFGFLSLSLVIFRLYFDTIKSKRFYFILLLMSLTATIFLNLRFGIIFFFIISNFNINHYSKIEK